LTFQNHTDCPLTDFGGKTSIFSHPVYLFLRKFSLQDSRGGSVITGDGPLELRTPRDRDGTFEPQLVKKNQTRITGMDNQILSL
ncbi:transposase, partial [Escherichia coli]|uniref:transposase n=1 Tax=Escherichia coli TaxID=562 RepID=UPI001F321288